MSEKKSGGEIPRRRIGMVTPAEVKKFEVAPLDRGTPEFEREYGEISDDAFVIRNDTPFLESDSPDSTKSNPPIGGPTWAYFFKA